MQNKVKVIDLRLSGNNYSKTNPFVVELKGKIFLQPKPNYFLQKGEKFINENGEILADTPIMGRRKLVDKTEFIKVYYNAIRELIDLSEGATKLLISLSKFIGYENELRFSFTHEYKETGYKSRQTVTKYAKELIEKGVIAPAFWADMWWVNPIYICKGERFAMLTAFEVNEGKEATEVANEQVRIQPNIFDQVDNLTQRKITATNRRAEKEYNTDNQ